MSVEIEPPETPIEDVQKRKIDRRVLYTGLATIALATGVAGVGVYEYLKRKRREQGDEKLPIEEGFEAESRIIESDPKHYLGRRTISAVVHRISRSIPKREKAHDDPPDIRFIHEGIEPLITTVQAIPEIENDLLSEAGLCEDDNMALRRLLGQFEVQGREIHEEMGDERRRVLLNQGLYVVQPNDHQWKKMERIMKERWRFPTLRNMRHGIKPGHETLCPRNVVSYNGWLAVRNHSGDISGYASFIPLEYIDPEAFDFEGAEMYGEHGLIHKKVGGDNLRGSTFLVTSICQDPALSDFSPTEALFYGIEDYARFVGAQNVLLPSFSPYVALHQKRDFNQRGETQPYRAYWNRTSQTRSGRERYADPWRRVVDTFSIDGREIGFSERFMEGSIPLSEVLYLLSLDAKKRGQSFNVERAIRNLQSPVLFLRSSDVPLVRTEQGSWSFVVPAGWRVLYNKDTCNYSRYSSSSIYRPANYP